MRLAQIPTEQLQANTANDVERAHGDPRIEKALDALRSRPSDRWTVARLAKVAGLSRAAFARRFLAEVGSPPLRHLARLRIARAQVLLAASDISLAEVATEVGYATEFALSRAFRRVVGEAPGAYRRRSGHLSSLIRCRAA